MANGPNGGSQVAVQDDGVLYDRWLERRDGDAFAELCRRHSPVVFDLTCRVLQDRAGAEDVLQEALLGLALERTRRPVEVGVVAWLARFALCRAKNRRASERARTRRQIAVGRERPEDVMPEERLERREETERALAACDSEDRALLAMRFLHEWEYPRIASALSITEGAARVRVHRALANVRSRLEEGKASPAARDAHVRAALALLPTAALSPDAIEGSIRTVVELAKVRLGAEPNGVEHATAATRGLRVALTCGAASFLLAVSASVAVVHDAGSAPEGSERTSAALDRTGGAMAASLASFDVAGRPRDRETSFVVPRPEGWDRDPFHAVTGSWNGPARDRAAPAADAAREAGGARDAAPAAAAGHGAAEVVRAAGPAVDANAEELESALRPSVRGTCAAKGGSASSDDDRAGALPGSSTPSAGETPDADDAPREMRDADGPAPPTTSPATPTTGARPRAAGPATVARRAAPPVEFVALDALPDDQRALVSEAEALLRNFLAAQGRDPAVSQDDPTSVREQVRQVRTTFGKLRKNLAPDADASSGRPAKMRRKAALVNRVLTTLAKSVYSAEGVPAEFLWPAGADGSRALAEVVRVLGAATPAGLLPSGALPAGAEEGTR